MKKVIEELKKKFNSRIVFNKSFKNLTSFGIGGQAKIVLELKNEKEIHYVLKLAKKYKLLWRILGAGTNIVAPDIGYNGLVIKIRPQKIKISGRKIIIGGGNNLLFFIKQLNNLGLKGMEKIAGIPGTVGGAIFGNVGAYGQEIKDCLEKVIIFDGYKTRELSKKQCKFDYRHSIFKQKNWVIISAHFYFKKADSKKLNKISRDILKIRNKKYPINLKCPGSFFKNLVIKNLSVRQRKIILKSIEPKKINHNKLPAAFLLEKIGAKGMKIGNIAVADYHANLIYNRGNGKFTDLKKLASVLKKKVNKKFGIALKEEVVYL